MNRERCGVGSGEMVEGVTMRMRQLYQWHKEAVRTDAHRLGQQSLHEDEDPRREAYDGIRRRTEDQFDAIWTSLCKLFWLG